MQIRIDNLSVTGLGPIASIQWQFQDINLVYGRNEQGKTFIVEYLLSSLFKNSPKTRPLTDSGQINISGLVETGLRFDPKTKDKIEDYLFKDEKPVDLSRLLVIKAGETKFPSNSEKGITKAILKDYLSNQQVLDFILNSIPVNIQRSSWENGQLIIGSQQGVSKEYKDHLIALEKADRLLNEVAEKYALGEIVKEKLLLEEIDRQLQTQEQARRYSAYQKQNKILMLSKELQQLPQEELDEIKKINNQIQSLKKQIQKDKNQITNLAPKCADYQWLETAIAECEKRPEALALKSDLVYIILGVVFIIATVVFAFYQKQWGALASGFLAALLFMLTSRQYRSKLQQSDDITEINRIFSSFEKRFAQTAHAITDLKSLHAVLQRDYYVMEQIKAQYSDNQREFDALQHKLDVKLSDLITHMTDFVDLDARISVLQEKRDALEETHTKENIALASLGVDPKDYLSDPVDTQFDFELFNKLTKQKDSQSLLIQEKEDALQVLKQRVCDLTDSDINSDWDEIINALQDHRDQVSQQLKERKAKIGAGTLVAEVIKEIQSREDENIAKALFTNTICEPIKALTGTYHKVEMEGEDIIVCSKSKRFPLHQLSTGAQEQILLALRIGIAAHYLKDRKMFLILDDAFQHSDWQRREWMVDQMADLATIGWQIIYFAMDDHIKQLFEERIKPKFKDRYAVFELTN